MLREQDRSKSWMTGGELARSPMRSADDYRVIAPHVRASEPLVSGTLYDINLRPGLSVHSADVRDLTGMTVKVTLQEGLGLVILLDGCIDVSFDHHPLRLDARKADGAQAAFISRLKPTLFTRRSMPGDYARKVSLSVSRGWLEAGGLSDETTDTAIRHLMREHLSVHNWTPSQRAVALAEQMIRPPDFSPLLQHLYLESRSLELIGEALSSLADLSEKPADQTSALRPRVHRRMQELKELLESGAADGWGVDAIARHVGMNPTSLQRAFRQVFGTTVFEHLREYRLGRAREALERGEANVAQAAEIAGYTSAANFSTAFKRRFGLSPRRSKSWL